MRLHALFSPASLVFILCVFNFGTRAGDHTWIGGGGSDNWSLGSNWLEGAPADNESGTVRLIFPTNAISLTSNNDITFTVPIEIQFTPHNTNAAYPTMTDTGSYTITGNAFQLTPGGITSTSANANTIGNGIQLPNSGSATVTLTSGNLNLSGAVTGSATSVLIKDGNFTLTFSSTPVNTGLHLQVSTGLVVLNKTGNANAVEAIDGIATGATVRLLGTSSATDQIADIGGVFNLVGTFDLNGYSEAIDGLAGLNQGTITNNGASTATLTLGANNATFSYGGTLTDGTGVLALAKAGSGTLTLTASNTYTGGLTISDGTFQMGNFGSLNSTTPNSVTFANNTNAKILALNGFDLLVPSLTATGSNPNATVLNGSSSASVQLTVSSSTLNSTFNGVLADGGSRTLRFFKGGTATVTLGGNNTFTDGVVIGNGELVVTNAGALNATTPGALTFPMNGNAKILTLQDVSLSVADIFSPIGGGSKTIRSTGAPSTLTVQQNSNVNYDGVLTGSLALVKSGSAALTLSGANTFNGGITIADGEIIVGNASALNASTPAPLTFSNNTNTKTLSLNGFNTTVSGLSTGTPVGTVIVRNNHAVTPATLTVSNASNMTFGGVLTNGSTALLNFVKSGAGVLTLTQSNTFGGTTDVNGGTLVVDGSLGSGAVNANNGGTLSGAGSIGGPVTINAGGTVNPFSVGTAGQFSLLDNLTIAGTYAADIAGSTSDQLSVAAAHTVSINAGSSLAFNTISTPTAISYDILASGSPSTGTFTNVTGVPTGYVVRYVGNNVLLVRVPRVTSVTSMTSDGPFGAGSTINVTVNFSEPVSLTGGNLNVTLDTGAVVSIVPFNNASSASATYTVAAGQNSPDLNSTALTLASGAVSLRNAASEDAILTIPPGQSLSDSKAILVDTTPPTVTIEQATNQVEPTLGPILFSVTFSDPVTGFNASDITLGGTAGATTAEVSGSGAQYTVSVSGMSVSGTVTAFIAANAAFDAAGNGNTASTSQDNSVVYAPLAFSSGPTANPMPGLVGAPVQFAVSVNYIATIAWNFGDGSLATGASVNHAFLPLGVYNVTVTATHANGQTVTASLSVQVVPSDAPTRDTDGDGILTSMDIDSDGDGFPDEIEVAAGTDPLNATKTPFDDQTRGMVNAINVTAKLITLNLAKDGRDSLLLTGELSVPADFVATDKTVIFDIAGKIRSFVLKKNGSAGKSVERLQLKIKRLKVPASQSAPFTLKTTRDSLKERLANNAPLDGNGFATQVTVVLLFNNTYYQSVLPLSFQAQKNPTLQVSK